MYVRILIFMLAIAAPGGVRAQSDTAAVKAELASLDRQWQEAVVRGDAEFIDQRTASSFLFTHGGGTQSDTKADWLRITRRVPARFVERKAGSQSVEVHGDVGLVFGRLDIRTAGTADAGPRCYAIAYVHVYARDHGVWMFLSHRTTETLESPRPCAEPQANN